MFDMPVLLKAYSNVWYRSTCIIKMTNIFIFRGDTLRVLFVADPQLQGVQDESAVFGAITRWDADRYIFDWLKFFITRTSIHNNNRNRSH